ncbi:MAG: VOC family protein [Rhodospirillaceae bacterium]|nr:VOC family protein [Rhodospirillaceae bacterium]
MLGPILAVTLSVPDLAAVERAYGDTLGYQVVDRGEISASVSELWDSSAVTGRPFLVMQPASGADVHFRFVQSPPVPGYSALKTLGWNANELLVEDVDAMPERLKESGFEIVAMPRNLSTTDDIKAMQAYGPAGEMIYFTTIKNPAFGLGQAESFVDRVFIVINGGRTMQSHLDFYGGVLGLELADPQPVRMSALNKIYGYDSEEMHPLSTANIGGPFMIELDQYPDIAIERPILPNDIPPGISIVSFQVDSLDSVPVDFRSGVSSPEGFPYGGGRAGVIVGPNGEWLELVERP